MRENNKLCNANRSFCNFMLVAFTIFHLTMRIATASEGTWKSTILPKNLWDYSYDGVKLSPDNKSCRFWNFEWRQSTPFGYSFIVRRGDGPPEVGGPISALSPDLAYLAIGTEKGAVSIVDLRDKKIENSEFYSTRSIKPEQADSTIGVQALIFVRPADKWNLIVADGGSSLTSWDPASGKELAKLVHGRAGSKIFFAPGPKETLLVGIGSEVRKTDFFLAEWNARRPLSAAVIAMIASENHRRLAIATADRSIAVLDSRTFELLKTWKESSADRAAPYRISLGISPKGDRVFTTTNESNGMVTVWDTDTGEKSGSFQHRIPANKMLNLSVTAEGKVKTYRIDRGADPTLLWSPPEGVELLPPGDLNLVYAKVVKVGPRQYAQNSEWRILDVLTGDSDLKGKRFTLETLAPFPQVRWDHRGYGLTVYPDLEGYLWVKKRFAEGDLVAEVDSKRLSEFDPLGFFPALGTQRAKEAAIDPFRMFPIMNEKSREEAKTFVGAFVQLVECSGDAERVKVLEKFATSGFDVVSEWAIFMLGKRKEKDASQALHSLSKTRSLSIGGQIMLDGILSKRNGETWMGSATRKAMLAGWVDAKTLSTTDARAVAGRLGEALRSGELDYATFGILIRRAFDPPKMIEPELRNRLVDELENIRPKTASDKREMFDLLTDLLGRKDIVNVRMYAVRGLKQCGPFNAAQLQQLEKRGITKAEVE